MTHAVIGTREANCRVRFQAEAALARSFAGPGWEMGTSSMGRSIFARWGVGLQLPRCKKIQAARNVVERTPGCSRGKTLGLLGLARFSCSREKFDGTHASAAQKAYNPIVRQDFVLIMAGEIKNF